jgi:thioredoxin reductase
VHHHRYLIVGAGPAGLQMAYFLERAGRDYLVLEAREGVGSFFETQPRHRTLLSINKRHNIHHEPQFNMRHDWNSLLTEGEGPLFRDYSDELYPNADDLVRYLTDFAETHALKIRDETRVVHVDRDDAGFVVQDHRGETYRCDCLLMATGAIAPYLPDHIEGIELAEGYEDYDLDPTRFTDKEVLVIGRGNSALQVAEGMAAHAGIIHIAIGDRPLDMAWQTHFAGDVRAINNTVLEMLHLKSLHGAVGFNVQSIRPRDGGGFHVAVTEELVTWHKPGRLTLELEFDHVIRCTGWRYYGPKLFSDAARPAPTPCGRFAALDDSWQSTVPGMYFIGTTMKARDKKAASSFIHGFRYNIRTLHHLLEERYEGVPLPSERFPARTEDDLRALAEQVLERMSTTDALYQLYGFLCDTWVIRDGEVEVYRELPRDLVLGSPRFRDADAVLVMNMEYGEHYPEGMSTMSVITQSDEQTSRRCAFFLHPAFRRYERGELVDEDNLGESLTLRWGRYRLPPSRMPDTPETEGTDLHVLLNLLNRATGISDTVWSEAMSWLNHRFEPLTGDVDRRGRARCNIRPS